jgi:hypothetical protein
MDTSMYGSLLNNTGTTSMDVAFHDVTNDWGGDLNHANWGNEQDLPQAFKGAGADLDNYQPQAYDKQNFSMGSDSGKSVNDLVNQYDTPGDASQSNDDRWGRVKGSLASSLQKNISGNANEYKPRPLTSQFPLEGHMYMRKHETPDPVPSKKAQSEDPRSIWMRWYNDMNTFSYKGGK